MKRQRVLMTSLAFTVIVLLGCSSTHPQEVYHVSSHGSLHNYDREMMDKALRLHPDFPKLEPNETKNRDVVKNGKAITVIYSSTTSGHGNANVTTDTNGTMHWSEATRGTYFVMLNKIEKSDQGDVESYWTYEFNPKTHQLNLINRKTNVTNGLK